MKYILLNGHYHTEGSNIFPTFCRAITNGDCLSELIHSCADRLCYFDEHIAHLRQGMKLAQMHIPEKFFNSNQEFYHEISKLLSKNRVFRSSNVTITVMRTAETMLSTADNIDYMVTVDAVDYLGYEINKDGVKIDIYKESHKSNGIFAQFISHDDTLLKAAIRKKCINNRLNDMLMLSPDGYISESSMAGNVFVVCNDVVMTPPLSDGCCNDIIRQRVIETAQKLGFKVDTQSHISENHLEQCSEIFLASTKYGIRWVGAYRNRRFLKSKVSAIYTKVNEGYLAERIEED